MKHRMARDGVGKFRQLRFRWQVAVKQQICHLHERRLFGQLLNRIAAVKQNALVAVDKCDCRFAASRRCKARIKGKMVRRGVKLADIEHIGTFAAFHDGQVVAVVSDFKRRVSFGHIEAPSYEARTSGLARMRAGYTFTTGDKVRQLRFLWPPKVPFCPGVGTALIAPTPMMTKVPIVKANYDSQIPDIARRMNCARSLIQLRNSMLWYGAVRPSVITGSIFWVE